MDFQSKIILLTVFNFIAVVYSQQPNPPCTIGPLTCHCPQKKYRTLEGTCNNLNNTVWGAYNTRYNRLMHANYGNKISSPPISVTGKKLPSARLVSTTMFGAINYTNPVYTVLNMQWGQILAHDMGEKMSRIYPVKKFQTCCIDGKLKKCYENVSNLPIIVPPNDPIYGKINVECLRFRRAVTDKNVKCPDNSRSKPAQQISGDTSYMDLSLVYGNNNHQNNQIRAFSGGRMIVVKRNGQCYPPQVRNVTKSCPGTSTPNEPCYQTGDPRSNQTPQLAILQILLLREHNLIADELASINPHWSDEKLFQVARSINIGQYQQINYYEWLPIFLGFDNMIRYKLMHGSATGGKCINDYQREVDASILNEHSSAAFRFFHTQIVGYLALLSQNRKKLDSIRLSDWFDRPAIIEKNKNFLSLSIGMATQRAELTDTEYDAEIKHFLFRFNRTFGTDLVSIDIQRGRDCGLATYNDLRYYCGLPRANSWSDYYDYIPIDIVDKLKTIYASYEDVDLRVGGSLENIVKNTLAGPTFLCILSEQFYRTRHGDRFFFENCEHYGFNERQLKEIRKATIANILCRNTEMKRIQRYAFSRSNKLVSCKKIAKLDLLPWKE